MRISELWGESQMALESPAEFLGDGPASSEPVFVLAVPESEPGGARPASPSAVLSMVSAALMVVSAAGAALGLFLMSTPALPGYPGIGFYDLPLYEGQAGWLIVTALILAALQAVPRSRLIGAGLAAGYGIALLARDFAELRPSGLSAPDFGYLAEIQVAAAAAAGVVSIVSLVRTRGGRTPATGSSRAGAGGARARTLWCEVLGLAAMATWATGWLLDDVRFSLGGGGLGTTTYDCCGIASPYTLDWVRAEYVAVIVVFLAAAVAAVRSRSDRRLAAALWAGPALTAAAYVLEYAGQIAFPVQSLQGWRAAPVPASPLGPITVNYAPLPGFWLTVAGIACVLVVAVVRGRIGAAAPEAEAEAANAPSA